ncbi:MAG TPA: sodium:solute symporter [Thermoguttaceae bacterium]|nr:sodium:solute symporter [Thermoguttaceae bacterium]
MSRRQAFCTLTILTLLGVLACFAPALATEAMAAEAGEMAPVGAKAVVDSVDWVVIVGYFALLLGLAWWVIRKNKDTADDYFLAGRNLGWFIVGASIFASNIGSEHLVGLAGSGTSDGVAMAHYELHAWCLLVLGWVLVPFYMRSKVFTMPEFLERRFNPTSRWVLSVISLVAYVVTKIAVGIFAGGIVFSVLLPDVNFMGLDSFWLGSILVIVATGAYTALGGLRAVAYTEALQTVILVAGSILVTIFGLKALGGWEELRAIAGSEMFNLWKPIVPEGVTSTWAPVKDIVVDAATGEKSGTMAWYFNDNYPWLSMLFCAPVIGLWYWCTDQYIVQRTLGAPDETEARRGSICAAFLKLLPVFIFIIPGIICFALMLKTEAGHVVQGGDARPMNFEKMLKYEPYLTRPELMAKYDEFVVTEKQTISDADGQPSEEVSVAMISWEKVQQDKPRFEMLHRDIRAMRTADLLAKYPEFVVEEGGLKQLDLARMADEAPEKFEMLRGDIKGNIDDSGMSFPMLVATVLPSGVRGLVVAGLLAALMSSLAGVFNASATLFTMDFYSKIHPNVSQHRLVWIGRVATVVMILIGLSWIPVIQGSRGLYDYLQGVQAYLAPPIFVVFFLGIFWKRLNGAGCLASLTVGFIHGMFRLAIDTPVKLQLWGVDAAGNAIGYVEGSWQWVVYNMFFQYFSILILLVCAVAMVVVSYLTREPDYEQISGLTYGTLTDEDRAESRGSWSIVDVAASAIVLAAILAAYLYFNG